MASCAIAYLIRRLNMLPGNDIIIDYSSDAVKKYTIITTSGARKKKRIQLHTFCDGVGVTFEIKAINHVECGVVNTRQSSIKQLTTFTRKLISLYTLTV